MVRNQKRVSRYPRRSAAGITKFRYQLIQMRIKSVCQSVRFPKLAEVEKEEVKEEKEVSEPEKKGPKPTDWRWGPAQYWYDMLELPEEVPDYDYGLKIRNKEGQRRTSRRPPCRVQAGCSRAKHLPWPRTRSSFPRMLSTW